jgi:3-mercaptopyruvate sulfurtransferase SseA
MRLFTYSILVLLLALFLTACNGAGGSAATQTQSKPVNLGTPYPDGARRITIDDLETLMKAGQVFVVDVRMQDSFDAGHIPGSKLIPSTEIADRVKELPRDKIIVTYCS